MAMELPVIYFMVESNPFIFMLNGRTVYWYRTYNNLWYPLVVFVDTLEDFECKMGLKVSCIVRFKLKRYQLIPKIRKL